MRLCTVSRDSSGAKSLQLPPLLDASSDERVNEAIVVWLVKPASRIDEKPPNANGKRRRKTGRSIDEKHPNPVAEEKDR